MKKIRRVFMTMLIFMIGCSNTKIKIQEEQSVKEERILSVEELILAAGIDQSTYLHIDLEQFIKEYEITNDNVKKLNIPLLLEDYEKNAKKINVSDIFRVSLPARKSNYTEDVAAVAYYENKGTSTECVYYDLQNNYRYQASNIYIFNDLNQVQPEVYKMGNSLLLQLEKIGVFSWENINNDAEIEDVNNVQLVILYSDGSVCHVSFEGTIGAERRIKYNELRELLLG